MAAAAPELVAIAEAFALPGPVTAIAPLGNGNVNDTYRVDTASGESFVLQRLNTGVFAEPELVMANLLTLAHHVKAKGDQAGCQVPSPVPLRNGGECLLRQPDQSAWRLLTFIAGTHSLDVLENGEQAEQVGRGLGRFHALVHDLPGNQLHDTLEGFHITPRYLKHYQYVLTQSAVPPCPESEAC